MRFTFFTSLLVSLLVACNSQKKIAKSARQDVYNSKALRSAHVGITIFEPATGRYWYNYQGDKYFVPASNTKIPTCYAAMKYLGDSLIGIRYTRQGKSLLVLPTGDPSFLHPDFSAQPVVDFLVKDSADTIIWTDHFFKDEAWGSGWSWNDYTQDYMAERSALPIHGNLVTIKDTANTNPKIYINRSTFSNAYPKGYRITRDLAGVFTAVASERKFTPTEIPFVTDTNFISQSLSRAIHKNVSTLPSLFNDLVADNLIHSQPIDSVLKPMMHRSDNFFAEQSLLMVSNEMLGMMNDARIIDTILKTDFKDLPQKPRWVDGSGLSRYNLFTPQDLVAILDKMQKEFGMARIREVFPTGNEGTLNNYYKTAQGSIYAKTGTLSGVVAISGFLYTKKNRMLIFSVLVNNHQASATEVRRAVEKFILQLKDGY